MTKVKYENTEDLCRAAKIRGSCGNITFFFFLLSSDIKGIILFTQVHQTHSININCFYASFSVLLVVAGSTFCCTLLSSDLYLTLLVYTYTKLVLASTVIQQKINHFLPAR